MRSCLLLLPALLGACASQSGLGRATTLEVGASQVTPLVEGSFVSARFSPTASTAPWLQLGIGYRRGLTERFELGARAWGFGLQNYFTAGGVGIDAKVQLYRGERVHLAVAPNLKYHAIALADAPWHVGIVEVPVLLGINLGPHQLVLGVRVSDALLTGAGTNPVNTFWLGAHLGVSFRIKRVELMPEVGLLVSPVAFNGETPDPQRGGASLLHAGVSVAIDTSRPRVVP